VSEAAEDGQQHGSNTHTRMKWQKQGMTGSTVGKFVPVKVDRGGNFADWYLHVTSE